MTTAIKTSPNIRRSLQNAKEQDIPVLDFNQTLPRQLVHRIAVAEVFLTDARRVGNEQVWIGAQLPTAHAYFHDHTDLSRIDPMLLMEICRQATLATAHILDVPKDVTLISQELQLDEIRTDLKYCDLNDVQIYSSFKWTRFQRGVPRAGVCEQHLYAGGNLICKYISKGILLKNNNLAYLRMCARNGQTALTNSFSDVPYPDAVPPHMVGRYNPTNVVLSKLESNGHTLSAIVSPRWSNRALLDHSYDHLTMQILIEACRQIAYLALLDAAPPTAIASFPSIKGMQGTFLSFAELDSPVRVTVERLPYELPTNHTITVTIEQESQVIATTSIHCEWYGENE